MPHPGAREESYATIEPLAPETTEATPADPSRGDFRLYRKRLDHGHGEEKADLDGIQMSGIGGGCELGRGERRVRHAGSSATR